MGSGEIDMRRVYYYTTAQFGLSDQGSIEILFFAIFRKICFKGCIFGDAL